MASSSVINQPKQWGVTRPRSTDYPTNDERVSTCRLVEVLAQYYPQKSKEEHNKQKAALEKLEHIVKDWVRQLPNEMAKQANAKLFTFGSYRLQVDEPGSVIDTLCVGPAFVKRKDDFFITLRGKLEKMSEVIGMECVHDLINIPFLSFKLDGVAIKLVYAELSYHLIPENFRTALMCVKYWANVRCIWSNVSGFLGDREWPILVARVCQAYPNAAPSKLVTEFFNIFARWCWPNPVMLCPIEHMGFTAWDPKHSEGDRNHCMPIMCPVYPHENLKIHATTSTLRVMKENFEFGAEKCKAIGQKEGLPPPRAAVPPGRRAPARRRRRRRRGLPADQRGVPDGDGQRAGGGGEARVLARSVRPRRRGPRPLPPLPQRRGRGRLVRRPLNSEMAGSVHAGCASRHDMTQAEAL